MSEEESKASTEAREDLVTHLTCTVRAKLGTTVDGFKDKVGVSLREHLENMIDEVLNWSSSYKPDEDSKE